MAHWRRGLAGRVLLRWSGRRPFLTGALGGALFSVVMALAFAPVGLWPLAFVAVLPLVAVAEGVGARRRGGSVRAALGAWVGATPWWAYAMVWTARNTQAGYPPAVLVLSVYAGLFVWAFVRLRRRFRAVPAAVLVSVLWVGMEVVRGEWVLHGYPWYLVAHPLIDAPSWWFTWPATIAGAYAVSVLAVLPVAAAVDGIAGRVRTAWVGVAVVGVWGGVGVVGGATGLLHPEQTGQSRFGVVQTDVPQSVRGGWDPADRWREWLRLRELTVEALGEGTSGGRVDAIVWPETMFPGVAFEAEAAAAEEAAGLAWFIERPGEPEPLVLPAWAVREQALALQETVGVPLIVGAAGFDGFRVVEDERGLRYDWDARRNSVFLVDGGAISGEPYAKLRLVPFGEVMPYISAWPWLEQRVLAIGANGMAFDLEPGDGPVVLEVPLAGGGVVRTATPICFEVTVSGVVRRLVYARGERAADVLVVLTNDGWFGDWDAGRAHHLLAARWRCVELGASMVRSANTGVSAFVDVDGRVIGSTSSRVDGVLLGDVPMYAHATVFGSVVGLWPARVLGAAAVLACVVPLGGRRATNGRGQK